MLLSTQVDALHALMLHRMDEDEFVLATTAAALRMLSQVHWELTVAQGLPPPLILLAWGVPASSRATICSLVQPATRAALLAHPEVVAHRAELLQHPVKEVRWLRTSCSCHGWSLHGCAGSRSPLAHHLALHASPSTPFRRPAAALQVVHAADAVLDAVAAGSEEWAASVRRLKFEAHNREWLQVVQAEERAASEQRLVGAGWEAAALPAPVAAL